MSDDLHKLIAMGKSFDILYVEDDASLHEETRRILERIFKGVTSATNGEEALALFQSQRFDLMITDIEMPKMNGLQLSQAIKASGNEIPIIVISAYSNTSYFIEAIKTGISNYILKPINMPELISTLLRVLNQIQDIRLAKEAETLRQQKAINEANIALLNEIVNANPDAQLVFKEREVVLVNAQFKALFKGEEVERFLCDTETLRKFLNTQMSQDPVLIEHSDYMESIEDFSMFSQGAKKVAIKTAAGRKLFLLQYSQFHLNDEMCELYVFNDITLLEYQRIQLDSYQGYMNDLAYEKYKQSSSEYNSIINKTEF